jgi:hypothetical protein
MMSLGYCALLGPLTRLHVEADLLILLHCLETCCAEANRSKSAVVRRSIRVKRRVGPLDIALVPPSGPRHTIADVTTSTRCPASQAILLRGRRAKLRCGVRRLLRGRPLCCQTLSRRAQHRRGISVQKKCHTCAVMSTSDEASAARPIGCVTLAYRRKTTRRLAHRSGRLVAVLPKGPLAGPGTRIG